jgi:hypothetical protein
VRSLILIFRYKFRWIHVEDSVTPKIFSQIDELVREGCLVDPG